MKAIRFGTLMSLGLALSFVVTGFHSENLKKIPGTRPYAVDVNPLPPIPPTPPVTNTDTTIKTPLPETPGHTNWPEDRNALKEYAVHFAYDSSVVKAADKSK